LAFFTTPAGLRWDANVSNDAEMQELRALVNLSWNTFLDVAVARRGEGWFVEMHIPLSSLRFQDIDGRVVMGIITWRWIPRKNEVHTFQAIRPDSGFRPSWKVTVRYYGLYSNAHRGKMRKAEVDPSFMRISY